MISLSERIVSAENERCSALVLPFEIDSVISLCGSFSTQAEFSIGEGILQGLTVSILDKGTKGKNKFEIAGMLEDRGASIFFSSDGPRISFSVRCLAKDFDCVFELLAEQLIEPVFDEGELDQVRSRYMANIERQKQNTGYRSGSTLSRSLYKASHPRFKREPEEIVSLLESYSIDDVALFFESHFSRADLKICVVGDATFVKPDHLLNVLEPDDENQVNSVTPSQMYELAEAVPGSAHSELADRVNIDLKLGHPLDIRANTTDYLALGMGMFVLGGNFSSRLMTVIRDEKGLTYGIRSVLAGASADHGGSWTTSVTLSQENIQKGLVATREVINNFARDGLSSEELRECKSTLCGGYRVQLATTTGVASRLLLNQEYGYDINRLDEQPGIIQELELETVNQMIAQYLRPDLLFVSSAGTLLAEV